MAVEKSARPAVKNVATAPIIYFDQTPTLGLLNNVIEIDLAARVLTPYADAKVIQEVVCVAHLRCSIEAVLTLRAAIDRALKMANYTIPEDGDDTADPSPGDAFARKMKAMQD